MIKKWLGIDSSSVSTVDHYYTFNTKPDAADNVKSQAVEPLVENTIESPTTDTVVAEPVKKSNKAAKAKTLRVTRVKAATKTAKTRSKKNLDKKNQDN